MNKHVTVQIIAYSIVGFVAVLIFHAMEFLFGALSLPTRMIVEIVFIAVIVASITTYRANEKSGEQSE